MRRIVFFLSAMALCVAARGNVVSENLNVEIDPCDGHIVSFTNFGQDVQFRKDGWIYGPAFDGVQMQGVAENEFIGVKDKLEYRMKYSACNNHLVLDCSIRNCSDSVYTVPLRERLRIGVNSQMMSFPQWDWAWFPTLLRCEKDFCWGYFGSTLGKSFAFISENPVASYGINYIYEGQKDWNWGHHIYTASLDLLHCGPLPERHPQDMDRLEAGQTRNWRIHFGVIGNRGDIKPTLSAWTGIPMVECSAYTVLPSEKVSAKIYGKDLCNVEISGPDGKTRSFKAAGGDVVELGRLHRKGCHTIKVKSEGHTSEAKVYVRPEWKWYLKKARNFIADEDKPRVSNACETYYGYCPAFKIAARYPDAARDKMLEERFNRQLPVLLDTATGIPYSRSLPHRIQNFSTIAGVCADLWRLTGNRNYLKVGARVADFVCSTQDGDGSYRSGQNKVHYTCVIYPAKSLFDLADAEREAGMEQEASRHFISAMSACEDLLLRLDNIDTEGDLTFEDGMISCSALQLAYAAMHCSNPEKKKAFTDAAEFMMAKHRCLEQLQIPDCRMRGATERFWEALDIYFFPNQVMNSPHGWTAWKLYAVYYLYKLTGRQEYKKDVFDTMGACAQIMNLNGNLRWGFIPDPYVDACICVPSDDERGWKHENRIVGEQYLERTSPWLRPADEFGMPEFGEKGGCGDGTTYEIFNAMAEISRDKEFSR